MLTQSFIDSALLFAAEDDLTPMRDSRWACSKPVITRRPANRRGGFVALSLHGIGCGCRQRRGARVSLATRTGGGSPELS